MFCKKMLWKSKTAITFAYDVEKSIIYQNIQQDNLDLIWTAIGHFANFKNPEILKGKNVILKFMFFWIFGQTMDKLLIQENISVTK